MLDPALFQLDPETLADLSSARRNAGLQYGQSQATTQYQRALAQMQYESALGNVTRKWDATREQLPGGFARRGLLNSGIYGSALQKYGTERQAETNQLSQGYQQQLAGYDLQNRQSEQTYQNALANIADAEQAKRVALAQQLRELL